MKGAGGLKDVEEFYLAGWNERRKDGQELGRSLVDADVAYAKPGSPEMEKVIKRMKKRKVSEYHMPSEASSGKKTSYYTI